MGRYGIMAAPSLPCRGALRAILEEIASAVIGARDRKAAVHVAIAWYGARVCCEPDAATTRSDKTELVCEDLERALRAVGERDLGQAVRALRTRGHEGRLLATRLRKLGAGRHMLAHPDPFLVQDIQACMEGRSRQAPGWRSDLDGFPSALADGEPKREAAGLGSEEEEKKYGDIEGFEAKRASDVLCWSRYGGCNV